MISLCISATASNQGKTILTTALLYYFRKSVRPFKVGPDYIDPQFHQAVCGTSSVNLDSFIMNNNQVKWLYNKYSNKKVSIIEGVMGFYDGDDKGCSAYSVSKLLDTPTILVLDGSGSYITISAVLKGLKTYKNDNTIKGVVLNNISSASHYEMIKKQIQIDHTDIKVLGWIENNIESLSDTHLGLDLNDLDKIKQISNDVLKYINIDELKNICKVKRIKNSSYPFEKIKKSNKTLSIIKDKNFSFLYYDNLKFLKKVFKNVVIVDSTKDEVIPKSCDIVYICGGYVETREAYQKIQNSNRFKNSLVRHSLTKPIYAECAGLLYLGNRVDDKLMSGILDIDFTLNKRFQRMGYYSDENKVNGHSFHYTSAVALKNGFNILSKNSNTNGLVGSWANKNKKVYGTYLHTMFRNNVKLLKDRFYA